MVQRALTAAKIFMTCLVATLLTNTAFIATTYAGGSNAPTPYTVTAEGVTLPGNTTFPASGHVNYKARAINGTTEQSFGVHFDPNNKQPGGRFIGTQFFGFKDYPATSDYHKIDNSAKSAFPGGYCITWVQVSMYNEHFGEGGQAPVCTTENDTDISKKIQFCHATGSLTNPYSGNDGIEVSVNAFYQAGHDDHEDDIVPPFSYVKHGQTINYPGKNWDAAHQAIYNNGCKLVVVPPTEVTPTQPTHNNACGTEDDTYTIPTTTGVNYLVNNQVVAAGTYAAAGSVTIKAAAQATYKLTGTAEWTFNFTNVACEEEPPVDVCPNIDGVQATVPTGYVIDQDDMTCQQPGGRGGDEPTPTTPPITAAQLPTVNTVPVNAPELANTGDNTIAIMLIGLASIVFALGAAFSVRQRN